MKIEQNINKISANFPQDIKLLTEMAKKSEQIMSEFNSIFKSKTLEKLYTPQYHYKGILPNSTYIIDRKTGKKKLMIINSENFGFNTERVKEIYTGKTLGLKKLGYKFFITNINEHSIDWGGMESYNNLRYAGTQIRLTQIEVERAMQIGSDYIPLLSCPEALPFHAMMGFKPNESKELVRTVEDVERNLRYIKEDNISIRKKFLTPIIHHINGKFYFDPNQTLANALIRQLKSEYENGIYKDFVKDYPVNTVDMNLAGKEFEAWRQRALSQPILLNKKNKKI